MECLTDPLGEACTRSNNPRPLRNCGCVEPACLGVCPTLCFFVPPVVTPGTPTRVSNDCIACTGAMCGNFVAACIADPVCFSCVTDVQNPKCVDSKAWNDTTDCLCKTPRTCFEECCGPTPAPP